MGAGISDGIPAGHAVKGQTGQPDSAKAVRTENAPSELKKKDFYFELPQELIAQDPLEDRSSSRLLVLDKHTGAISHCVFRDVESFLRPGDCLVLNNTKVIPARLLGEREETGAHVEVLLLKRNAGDVWETLVKPGKKCRPGTRLTFGDGLLKARVLEMVEEGNRLIQFEYDGVFEEVLDALGEMPLPPYITHKLQDKNRYQTVYARYEGSAAAPTAGLHFTKELLGEIEAKGVRIAYVTLHVGLGTFRPVKEENVLEHHMHSEYFQISEEAAEVINRTKTEGGRVLQDCGKCLGRHGKGTFRQRGYGHFYISRLSFQSPGRADHQLSSAGIHSGHAGFRTGRPGERAEGL